MKKTLIFASLVLVAWMPSAFAISQSPAVSVAHPLGMKSAVANFDASYQRAHLRCLVQNPCIGIPDKVYLSASASAPTFLLSTASGEIQAGFNGQAPKPLDFATKKAGQFTPDGHYVVGAHLLPTSYGHLHM